MKKNYFSSILISIGLLFMSHSMKAQTFEIGDVFAAVSNGQVYHYDATGNYLATLNCGFGGFTTGMAFDADDNLYVTEFSNAYITVFEGPSDPHTILERINTGTFGDASCESIVFDADGNFYVGHADGNRDIHKYNSTWNFLDQYNVSTEDRGSDWIDLAADQRTIFYTSEGRIIFRYDVVDDLQLTNFAALPGTGVAYALRILSDGGLLVADTYEIKRLDAGGTLIQTYDVSGENTWFSLNLDPDNTSFWAGNYGTGYLYKFDIASGTLLQTLDTGVGGSRLYGVTIFGELTAARVIPVAFDIKPQSCPNPINIKDKGTIPVAILGTADFNVTEIDPATLEFEGVAPLRWAIEDVATPVVEGEPCDCTIEGPDGFDDLTIKFDSQELITALGSVNNGDVLVLSITGNLLDGRTIEGSDCVVIRANGNLDKNLTYNLSSVPEEYVLSDNFPNPFNPSTTIQFAIPEQSFVKLEIYNSLGEKIKTLVNEDMPAGIYSVDWNAENLPSGTYIYHIQTNSFIKSKKMILMK
jgi:hypothetical protein